jgi:hypothetical protein
MSETDTPKTPLLHRDPHGPLTEKKGTPANNFRDNPTPENYKKFLQSLDTGEGGIFGIFAKGKGNGKLTEKEYIGGLEKIYNEKARLFWSQDPASVKAGHDEVVANAKKFLDEQKDKHGKHIHEIDINHAVAEFTVHHKDSVSPQDLKTAQAYLKQEAQKHTKG